jgi:predicted chitinase
MNANEILVYCRLKKDGFNDNSAAAVMGVVGGESAFQSLKEISYKNTSNSHIRAVFGSRLDMYNDEQLNVLKQNYDDFFNAVYGGRHGNAPNEGAKYVGRGFNGITFKGNYESMQAGINQQYNMNDFVNKQYLLENPEIAAMALSYYFRMVKNISEFEPAFQEAFRQNAGPGYSFAYYASLSNPVAVYGIPLKRNKGLAYLDAIKKGQFVGKCDNILGSSGLLLSFPILFFLTLGGYYLYKKYRK